MYTERKKNIWENVKKNKAAWCSNVVEHPLDLETRLTNLKNAIVLKPHKNPRQTNNITPNVVPTSQKQLNHFILLKC